MMRRLHLAFLLALPLCSAKSRAFSIHQDLLAFPQFEVVFSDSYISEDDAQSLIATEAPHPTKSADFSQPTIGDAGGDDNGHRPRTQPRPPLTYEVINTSSRRYLCSIPAIEPLAPENQTATEMAKAEEARELSRAAVSGWGLLSQLENTCLYFISGWWSYRFCNNREIVQFHALPSTSMGQPPRPDPHTAEYVLGAIPAVPATSETHAQSSPEEHQVPAELQVKGDQRYLVQKLEGGTLCDLTGRERTIEVQYHCVPGMQNDRIGWIKEVTICAYVMVINSPRLCNDMAFLPPEENKANPITCHVIRDDDGDGDDDDTSIPSLLLDQSVSRPDESVEQVLEQDEERTADDELITVGGTVVGGRKVISAGKDGQPPITLSPHRDYPHAQQAAEQLIRVLAQAASKEDGGKIEKLSKEELERLNLRPDMIEEMEEEMQRIAGDAGWQLEVIGDIEDEERQLRGWLHPDEEEVEQREVTKAKAKGANNKQAELKKGGKKEKNGASNGKEQQEDGSQEQFFKEDL